MLLATEPCEDFFFCWGVDEGWNCASSGVEETFSWGLDEDLSTPMLSRVDGVESIGSSSCAPFHSGATSPREKDCSGASSSSSSIK